MNHSYFFFLKGGLLYRYKLSTRGEKFIFEILRYSNDEEGRNYVKAKELWNDWEKDARYIEGEPVNFAFHSDSDSDEKNFEWEIPPKYSPYKPTAVSSDLIRDFFESKLNNRNIVPNRVSIPFPRKEAKEKPVEMDASKDKPKEKVLKAEDPVKNANKDDRFKQIDLAAAYIKQAGDFLRSTFHDVKSGNNGWFKKELRQDLNELIGKIDKAYANLTHPCLKIAFVGTTSSGKSTLLNGLTGTRIAPMDAGEMSAGVVRIRNAQNISLMVHETENMAWKAGEYPVKNEIDIYNTLRDQNKGIMNLYRRAAMENANVRAPEIEITAPLAPKNGGILGFKMAAGIDLEFYDLPGLRTVTDSGNLSVIQKYLAGSFLLIVLNYSDTDSDKRNKLLGEIKKIVDTICRNKEALLFILNRIDERNSDDDPLASRIKSLEGDIKDRLELRDTPVIIPMSALPLYYLQTAWGTGSGPSFKNGLEEKSMEQVRKFFDDCSKIIRNISKEDPDKKTWFKENDEDNIDDWAAKDMRLLLDWIYEYSGAYTFWKAMEKKLEEQIGAIIINPSLEGTPVLFEEFAKKLDGVVHVLGLSTKEEIQKEKDKVESISAEVKKNIKVFKEGFIKDFKESIEACKTRELQSLKKHKQFMEMRNILREITDDIHDTIMIPIRNALLKNDTDVLYELENTLSKVIPSKLASDIHRMTNQLLIKGYGSYAENGNQFKCRLEEKTSKEDEIRKLQEIDKRRMDLAGYVDQALLSRSKLLLQEKLIFFQGVTENIIQESMGSLAKMFSEKLKGFDTKTLYVPVSQNTEGIDLPENVFSKITIERADKVMKETVKESY